MCEQAKFGTFFFVTVFPCSTDNGVWRKIFFEKGFFFIYLILRTP